MNNEQAKIIMDVFTADADKPSGKKVTDPALLEQLNSGGNDAPKKITDPSILAQLNAQPNLPEIKEPQPENALMRGAVKRVAGTEQLLNNIGVGKYLGLPANEVLEEEKNIANEAGRGKGVMGLVGEIAGDPLTYVGGASLKAAKGLSGLAKTGGRIGAAEGLTSGGKDEKENLKKAVIGAGVGATLTPAIPAGLQGIKKGAGVLAEGWNARAPEVLRNVATNMRGQSDASYKVMRDLNAGITPKASMAIRDEVGNKLLKEVGIMHKSIHGDTMRVLGDFQKEIANGISIDRMDQWRRVLAGVARQNKFTRAEDSKMATKAIEALDEAVNNLKASDLTNQGPQAIKALKNAREVWAKARRFETITDIIEESNGDPNKLKSSFEQLYKNKKKIIGFNKVERKLIKDAASSTTTEGLLKTLGKFGVSIGTGRAQAKGNVIPAMGLIVEGFKKGIPLVAAGTGAKYMQGLAAKAKAERILKAIEGGGASNAFTSPSAGAMSGAMVPSAGGAVVP